MIYSRHRCCSSRLQRKDDSNERLILAQDETKAGEGHECNTVFLGPSQCSLNKAVMQLVWHFGDDFDNKEALIRFQKCLHHNLI